MHRKVVSRLRLRITAFDNVCLGDVDEARGTGAGAMRRRAPSCDRCHVRCCDPGAGRRGPKRKDNCERQSAQLFPRYWTGDVGWLEMVGDGRRAPPPWTLVVYMPEELARADSLVTLMAIRTAIRKRER